MRNSKQQSQSNETKSVRQSKSSGENKAMKNAKSNETKSCSRIK
jgi:hypothetical protein